MGFVGNWQRSRDRLQRTWLVERLRAGFGFWTTLRRMAVLVAVLVVFLYAFHERNELVQGEGKKAWRSTDCCAYSIPDGLPPYSSEELVRAFDRLPEGRRHLYAYSELTLDGAFPFFYASFLGAILLLLARSRKRGDQSETREIQLSFALLFPALAALADWIENSAYAAVALEKGGQWVASVGVAASWAKIIFLVLTILAIGVTGRSRWGLWLRNLMLARVPFLALVVLVLLPLLAGSDGLPTISNMMISKSALGLAIAVFAAVLTGAVIGLTASLALRLAPERFEVQESPLSKWLEDVPVLGVVLFAPLVALPMILRLWQGSVGGWASFVGLLSGLGAVMLPVLLLEGIRSKDKLQGVTDWLRPFFRVLGPGFLETNDEGHEKVRRGHPLALGVAAFLFLVYVFGYFWLRPDDAPETLPTIAYVLLLVAFLCQGLAGLSFFLDRFRFPLILGLVLYAVSFDLLVPQDHFFSLRRAAPEVPVPTIEEALNARLDLSGVDMDSEEPVLLTVIGASGGGIQAAAWTAQVLTGLEEALGPDFTRSIQLISSASGGSVGSLFFLEQLGAEGALAPEDGVRSLTQPDPYLPDPYSAVREAAMASSLDATAWGLVFPDFLRAFFPPAVAKGKDRAWAMEQAWLQNLACMKAGQPQETCGEKPAKDEDQLWLAHWRERASRGRVPGVIFNGTFVEDGEPLLISNLDLASLDPTHRPFSSSLWDYDGRTDFTLEGHYEDLASFDLPLVTAARLSATFPYVTPVARARWHESAKGEDGQPETVVLPRWHVADGGFFDNHGTTAAVRWIEAARQAVLRRNKNKKVRVLYIQVNGFPQAESIAPCEDEGWVYAALGPLKTIVNVRTSTQLMRNDLELTELQGRLALLDVEFKSITFRPPPQSTVEGAEVRIPEPLSWELSDANKSQVCNDWHHSSNQEKVSSLARNYFGLEEPAPPASCPKRAREKKG